MKKGNILTFFPGKGIFTNPDSHLEPIVSVFKKEEAVEIFECLTQLLTNTTAPSNTSSYTEMIQKAASKLAKIHGALERMCQTSSAIKKINLNFPSHTSTGDMRTSYSTQNVDWNKLTNFLLKNKYKVIKRTNSKYIPHVSSDSIHIYAIVHPTYGVVAEGKGYTDEQAKKSALAEAIERCYSTGKEREDIIIASKNSLNAVGTSTTNAVTIRPGPRDTFSDDIYTEWIAAQNITANTPAYIPAEIAFFNYRPTQLRVKLFSLSHTTGMAAGASIEDATMNGLFEIIERDAYWIMMRCKILCPDIDIRTVNNLNPAVKNLYETLSSAGFEISIKDISLDWNVPIAHVAIKDTRGRLPCFSHGSGAGSTWALAVNRALTEAVQMYFGMKEFVTVAENWEKIISVQGILGSATLAWSDPLFGIHIEHIFSPSPITYKKDLRSNGPGELLELFRRKGYSVIVAPILELYGLHVVRVCVPEATQPDERLERISQRLIEYKNKLGLKGFYSDPILT